MDRFIKSMKAFPFKGMLVIWGIFMLMGAVLFAERSGIHYEGSKSQSAYLSENQIVTEKEAVKELKKTCLVIMDSQQEDSQLAWEQFERIFQDMKVGTDVADLKTDTLPNLDSYETVVVLMSDLEPLKEGIIEISNWVKSGGSAMFAMALQKDTYASLIEQKLGIISSGYENSFVDSIYFDSDFLIGGGKSYAITDGFDSARQVELSEKAQVYAWAKEPGGIPLIWENTYGDGKFVVDNLGLYEKAVRGFYAASYSLLTDIGVYPVINGSAFYLDDFPSPVPSGDGTYVKRDYGTSIQEFYSNIWWPDMLNLASKYGLRYTGVMIENYEDKTDGEITKQTDHERFQYFGNMVLHQGGELGYHGYNHQPLCLGDTDYGDVLPYKTWKNEKAMESAMSELMRFGKKMFPGTQMSVYVPPSNVLSEQGRKMLAQKFPQIKTIASNYFAGECAYTQEFEVADDGIVEQPRIISGAILDDYMQMAAVSELNMHFVNSHFMHPDDLLDEDRGAKLGWEKLKNRLEEYMDWLYDSAPELRNLTGSELSGAIERYGALTYEKNVTDKSVELKLNHFYDEAYLMLRFNNGIPGKVTGGELEHVTGNLYLLHAVNDEVTIEKK